MQFEAWGDANINAAAMGGSYEFVKTASANLREKQDHWNVVAGGFASGALLGLRGVYFDSPSRTLLIIASTVIPRVAGLRHGPGRYDGRIRIHRRTLGIRKGAGRR